MNRKLFLGWVSDIGFTCRVLIIADMMDEWARTWGATHNSALQQAIDEVRETALLEMERYEDIGIKYGFFSPIGEIPPYANPYEDSKPAPG